jgi:hypothetical protein
VEPLAQAGWPYKPGQDAPLAVGKDGPQHRGSGIERFTRAIKWGLVAPAQSPAASRQFRRNTREMALMPSEQMRLI